MSCLCNFSYHFFYFFLLYYHIISNTVESNFTYQVQVLGKIVGPSTSAWSDEDAKLWLTFACVNGLHVFGNGQFDSQGESWWKSCPNVN